MIARIKLLLTIALIGIGIVAPRVFAQDSEPMTLQDAVNGYESVTIGHAGVSEDWSNHHLIFSRSAPASTVYEKVRHDPRFWLQQIKRSSGASAPINEDLADSSLSLRSSAKIKRDWTENFLAGGQVQPNMYPAKFTFNTTSASCTSDFAVFPTGVAGSSTKANIIAYYNLYTSGCSGSVPSVHWAYNTGGTVTLSTVISNDSTGSQVAYVQVSGTAASLVILKWAASTTETVTAPATLTAQSSGSNYRSCSAPCYYSIGLGANDTFSAPFYDYSNDAVYVGDDNGRLHKITGVFNGTPTTDASPWPVTLSSGVQTTSPVYDSTSGYVFAGNMSGFLYAVGSGNAGTANGSKHGTSNDLGDVIIDAPIVDSTAGKVYAFVTTDSSGKNGVYQFATSFTSGAGSEEQVGFGGTGYYLYAGNFDNVYYSSASGNAGDLWLMGNTGGSSGGLGGGGNLYRIPINSTGTMGTPAVAISNLTDTASSHYPWPSPLTEFCNNGASACAASGTATTAGTDYIFFSVNRLSATTGTCDKSSGDGCVLAYSINTPTNAPTFVGDAQVATPSTPGCWATAGIIIDNSVPSGTLAGASQIYLLELNANGAGGPTSGTYTSTACTNNSNSASPIALQGAQTGP